MKIPFLNLRAQHDLLKEELTAAFQRVLERSSFVLGPEVAAFEKEFANYLGVNHVIGVGSGTAALHVSMLALGIEPGDEVIVPAMTFYATAEAVAITGAKPVFADIDPISYCLAPEQVERAITPATRGILPVHMLGHAAEMDNIYSIADRHGLWICEDGAHAPGGCYKGCRIGSLGTIAAFSFYPGKNIGALGEAGAIATNDHTLAQLCHEYRNNGSIEKFRHVRIGINARMDEVQAALLRVKLPYLDTWNDARISVAKVFDGGFANVPKLKRPSLGAGPGSESIFHVYAIRVEQRDRVFSELQQLGINVNLHYPVPMHLHPGFACLEGKEGDFPEAELYAAETLSLPCFPELTAKQIDNIISTVREVISSTCG
ncbi:UDP-2-acetamido-2-deoxy-3-oxo-D-glucuronate aminotransferase [bacterium BMS3Bbin04]|nr:UDP-2-acetamido-2-deoxy-3-oxo-D-glucuronate aminotransferase [bacterium BMS3Bbin04]